GPPGPPTRLARRGSPRRRRAAAPAARAGVRRRGGRARRACPAPRSGGGRSRRGRHRRRDARGRRNPRDERGPGGASGRPRGPGHGPRRSRAGGAGLRSRRARLRGEAHRVSGPRARGPRGPARRAISPLARRPGAEAVAARAVSGQRREGGIRSWQRPARLVNPTQEEGQGGDMPSRGRDHVRQEENDMTRRTWWQLAAGLVAAALVAAAPSMAQAQAGKPNILVIFGDDIGWYNVSAYNLGVMGYRTPNIDRIAREGALFTDWHAQQSCTAGRAAFVTGQAPIRTGLT